MTGRKVEQRGIVAQELFQKFDDKDKLLKLIDDFSDIESIDELASIVYVIVKIHGGRFSYNPEDFEDFGPSGPMSRKLFEDLFYLEVREKYLSRRSRMQLTTEGIERVKRLGAEISFKDVKSLFSQVNKDQRTTIATYLHLRDRYSDDKKVRGILQSCCEVDAKTWGILKLFVKRQRR